MVATQQKSRKARKNRRRKDRRQQRQRWVARLLAGMKLAVVIAIVLTSSALFMAGYAAVTQSDYFRVETIRIVGNQRLTPGAVLAQAGVRTGDNLLALNLQMVRKRLLADPWIADARVGREIPATMVIYVTEQAPLAQVDLGRKFLMNAQGRIFKEVEAGDPQELPVIEGIAYGDISLGEDNLSPAMAMVLEVLRISRAAGSAIPYGEIERLRLDKQMGVALTLKGHQRIVKLGFDRYETKFERFKQLQPFLAQHADWRSFQCVDLNNPDRIVVQLDGSRHPGA